MNYETSLTGDEVRTRNIKQKQELYITVVNASAITDLSDIKIKSRQTQVRLKSYRYMSAGILILNFKLIDEANSAAKCGTSSLIAMVPGILFGLGVSLIL